MSIYTYAEQNPNRTRDICLQSWPFRSPFRLTVFTLRAGTKKWQVTRFLLWFFLSWGIDYKKKSSKTKFERITFWILTTLFPTVQRFIENFIKVLIKWISITVFKKTSTPIKTLEKLDQSQPICSRKLHENSTQKTS